MLGERHDLISHALLTLIDFELAVCLLNVQREEYSWYKKGFCYWIVNEHGVLNDSDTNRQLITISVYIP